MTLWSHESFPSECVTIFQAVDNDNFAVTNDCILMLGSRCVDVMLLRKDNNMVE